MFQSEPWPSSLPISRAPAGVRACPAASTQAVRKDGKFFRVNGEKWFAKGFTYGPFAPNQHGAFLPERPQMLEDFAQLRQLGANCIRLYHVPSPMVLDDALENGLRVFVDIPWEKHRCFFEDWVARQGALRQVRDAARLLGGHPGLFALSVANELPHDIVRYYGARRVETFINQLLQAAREMAPEALFTYTNYPSTEFLDPQADFYCANVYLEDPETLGRYLDRLQHIAGNRPLILGEYGLDSHRNGLQQQSEVLGRHIREVFRRGLAGSFVFAYTDDWFTGGHQVEDWAFGVTTRARQEKPAASTLRQVWSEVPFPPDAASPRVSVVVCSYNGAATLDECLASLTRLEYPDYEVILVDDGSTDATHQIAARYPSVRYLHQENRGLGVARNVGAEAATGQIVAYTDSDCVADEHWLAYLVQSMRDQGVDGIGGPNIPPLSDNWTARCVAVSPGGPSHVMLDDRRAEHLPGCNMAFRRDKLLEIGGFGPQYRQAGDDVDICWRFLDAGHSLGYAPGAVVWHHRRNTVGAYLRQQKGYGRSEALVQLQHPHRFNALGSSRWLGVIYGEGSIGLESDRLRAFHGQFGMAPFQIMYRQASFGLWNCFTLLEWHALAAFVATLALAWRPLLALSACMLALSLVSAARSAFKAPLLPGAPAWCRGLLILLYLAQPVVRSWHRYLSQMRHRRLPSLGAAPEAASSKRISLLKFDCYWESRRGRGREHLLRSLVDGAGAAGWAGDFRAEWQIHDIELQGDLWHDIRIRTATEELGQQRRFTRARCSLRLTGLTWLMGAISASWAAAGALAGSRWLLAGAGIVGVLLLVNLVKSRWHCTRATTHLLSRAARAAQLQTIPTAPLPEAACDEECAVTSVEA